MRHVWPKFPNTRREINEGTKPPLCRVRLGGRSPRWRAHPLSRSSGFLVDDVTPAGKPVHLIADNYSTHKHAKVQRWLKRHPRFHVYFTPTSASWLNMVERFFRDLTENRLRRGVFRDVEELIMAVEGYIDRHNENPKPFIWTAKANDILEKVKRARKAPNNVQSV